MDMTTVDYDDDIEAGRLLKGRDATMLERMSKENPSDARLHVRLAAYYGLHDKRNAARVGHLLFLIEHLADSHLWLNPELHVLDDGLDETSVREIVDVWREQTHQHDKNVELLINAAHYLMFLDPTECGRLLEQANQVRPNDVNTLYSLAQFYSSNERYDPERTLKYAAAGVKIAEHQPPHGVRLLKHLLALAGDAAIALRRADRCHEVAQQLVRIGENYSAHQLLGRAALVDGDENEAVAQFSFSESFLPPIPDLKLANELLELGKTEAVMTYLQCALKRSTDERVRQKIEAWIYSVASDKEQCLNW